MQFATAAGICMYMRERRGRGACSRMIRTDPALVAVGSS
eukprot:COSAG02_NODE_47844_length_338_cov_0.774059_1_plen_38_part_01